MELGYSTALVEEGVITPKWLFKTDTPSPHTSVTPSRNNDAIDAMALQQRTQRIWGPLCVFLLKKIMRFFSGSSALTFSALVLLMFSSAIALCVDTAAGRRPSSDQ